MKDLIIIGAGPIGLSCGIEAKRNNLDYLIIDKGMLVNSIFNYPTNTTFFSTSDKLEIGGIPFVSHNVKPTRTEALEYYRRVSESWELNLSLYNEVLEIKNNADHFLINTQSGKFKSKNIGYRIRLGLSCNRHCKENKCSCGWNNTFRKSARIQ